MIEPQIIIPVPQRTSIEDGLIALTKAIWDKHHKDEPYGYGFGGLYGYGANFENDIFLMHPYCWCDKDDCPWCSGCKCPDSAFHYFIDDKEVAPVSYYKVFYNTGYEELSKDEHDTPEYERLVKIFEEKIKIRNQRCKETKDDICEYCTGTGIFERFAYKDDRPFHDDKNSFYNPPNFWYKPLDLRITWYKYIGRDMHYNQEIDLCLWPEIINNCIESL